MDKYGKIAIGGLVATLVLGPSIGIPLKKAIKKADREWAETSSLIQQAGEVAAGEADLLRGIGIDSLLNAGESVYFVRSGDKGQFWPRPGEYALVMAVSRNPIIEDKNLRIIEDKTSRLLGKVYQKDLSDYIESANQ